MECPGPVQTALLHILSISLLRIRQHGWHGDATSAAEEADHVHTIPGMLRGFSTGALGHYFVGKRVSFFATLSSEEVAEFEEYWQTIGDYLSECGETAQGRSP